MTIPLQKGVLYGPMNSRRFGRSLGVNLLPSGRKICNFHCLYCQYDEDDSAKRVIFPSVERIKEETEDNFRSIQPGSVDWVMIGGNGEPTLHPRFEEAVDAILALRNQHLSNTPVGILSNASRCGEAEVRSALLRLDGRFMKLDAGSPQIFQALNGGAEEAWMPLLRNLQQLPNVTLQSMFVRGAVDNSHDEAVGQWLRVVGLVQPLSVQIYSIQRPPRDLGIRPVPMLKLRAISRRLFRETGIPSEVF